MLSQFTFSLSTISGPVTTLTPSKNLLKVSRVVDTTREYSRIFWQNRENFCYLGEYSQHQKIIRTNKIL